MQNFDINLLELLIILGAVQGLAFGLIILFNPRLRLNGNIFLALMLISTALSTFLHVAIEIDFLLQNSWLRKFCPPIQWLIIPFLYLNVHATLKRPVPKKQLWLIVAVIVMVFAIYSFNFWHLSKTVNIAMMPDHSESILLLSLNLSSFFFNAVLVYLVFNMVRNFEKSLGRVSLAMKNVIRWYRMIIWLCLAIVIIGTIIVSAIIFFKIQRQQPLLLFYAIVSFSLYFVGYSGVLKFSNLKDRKNPKTKSKKNGIETYLKINTFIVDEKQYLDNKVSLKHVADKFGISSGYLSHLINLHTQQHFNDYINELRVEDSKQMLLGNDYRNYTIEAIGLECGFNSKSNFYAAFKKFTHLTPNQFRTNNLS